MRAIGLAPCVLVLSMGAARAQGTPTTTPAPQPPPAPTNPSPSSTPAPTYVPPPPLMVGRPLSEHTVDRHGFLLLAGVVTDGDNGAPRVDVIVPWPLASAPQFRVGVSAQYDHSSASIPDLAISGYAFALGVKALYDWRVPVATGAGDFVISVEGGPFLAQVWIKVDQPFMPGDYQSMTGLGLSLAAALQYRAHNGFVASLQPIGINAPIATSEPDNTGPVMFTSDTEWEGALLCGFQFR